MKNPGLLHLHVHLMRMSPYPEAELVTGDRLRVLTPDIGHLVHMSAVRGNGAPVA